MLKLIAQRGGEIEYNYGRLAINSTTMTDEEKAQMVKDCDQSVKDMADKLGVITAFPLLGYSVDKVLLRLTDSGRQVIEQMQLMDKQQYLTLDMKTGKEKKGIIK